MDDGELTKLSDSSMNSRDPHCVFVAAKNPQMITLLHTINLEHYIVMPDDVGGVRMALQQVCEPSYPVVLDAPCVAAVIHPKKASRTPPGTRGSPQSYCTDAPRTLAHAS